MGDEVMEMWDPSQTEGGPSNGQKKEEKKSFFDTKMEGIAPEAFKKGKMKSPTEKKEQQKQVKAITEADKKRHGLIRLHNSYLRSEKMINVLHAAGYPCQMLPANSSLETAEMMLDQVNTILSANQSTRMAKKLMTGLNKTAEFLLPELKFGAPSLSDAFDMALEDENSQMALNIEELGLHLQPYVATSFWPRFLADYLSFVWEVREHKRKGTFYPQEQKESSVRGYNAFEELNEKFAAADL